MTNGSTTLAAFVAGFCGAVLVARLELMHPLFGLIAGVACALFCIWMADGDRTAKEDFEADHRDEWEGY